MPALVILSWALTGHWERDRIDSALQRQAQATTRQMIDAEFDIDIAFSQIKNLTNWVAEEGHASKAITTPASTETANEFLQRLVEVFNVDLVYVMNAQGISVASSNAGTPASTIGVNYSDRDHFISAIQGVPGRQFAIGRTTKVAGFFFSAPVLDKGKVIGTVAVKLNQDRLMRQIRIFGGLVSDSNGIVVIAENPRYMFMAVPGASIDDVSEAQRDSRYARKQFDTLPLTSAGVSGHPEVMLLENEAVVLGQQALPSEGLTVYVLSPFDVLQDARRQRQVMFLSGSLAAVVLAWGMWAALIFYLRARDYRRRLEVVNQQLSGLNSELHEQATHDYLTGCLNRRAFSALLSTELDRAQRYGGELSLAMLDLDHFKHVNDTRGHEVGDLVLRFFVDVLSRQLRRTDVLARMGGEEFALLMPNTAMAEAMQVIDRMRQTMESTPVTGQEPPLVITFSAGVAGWFNRQTDRELLSAADHALYEAKGRGRNCVVRAS
ncbi:MAG TPA: diguanylate cyclase [Rhodocyclaceae bacterium]|nr:diguanylate cyclase [Rhodocyclaceae bacterium]